MRKALKKPVAGSGSRPKLELVKKEPAMNRLTDYELVVAHRNGDPLAFATLYHRHAVSITGWINAMVKDSALAEDLTQEVFYRLHRFIHRIREDKGVGGWLRIVARRTVASHMRIQSKRRDDLSIDYVIADNTFESVLRNKADETEQTYRSRHLRQRIESAVESLKFIYREPFKLREFGGMEYQEIADFLHIPIDTVRTRLHRAKVQLAKMLEAEYR